PYTTLFRSALGRDVLRHLLADLVFGKGNDVDLDPRVRALEVRNQLLEVGHRGVVDRADRDGGRSTATSSAAGARTGCADKSEQRSEEHTSELPLPGSKMPIAHAASPLFYSARATNADQSDNVVKRQRCQI